MTHLLHRAIHSAPRVARSAQGIRFTDSEGRAYIDASGGAAVSCLGHAHPDVLAALHAQLDKLAYAHTGFFTTDVAEELADRLVADAPAGLDHVYLVSGGSEAVEAALKMARQYFTETGQPQRRHIIARRQSYHGNTLGALAAGGNEWRRAQFKPLLMEAHLAHRAVLRLPRAAGRARARRRLRYPRGGRVGRAKIRRTWPRHRHVPSSPNPWSGRRRARSRRWATITSISARSATNTACC